MPSPPNPASTPERPVDPEEAGHPEQAPLPEEAGRRRTRSREKRAVVLGLVVSALLHVVLVVLYPGMLNRVPDVRVPPAPAPRDLPVRGVEIVTFREVEDEPVTDEVERPPEIVLDLPDLLPTDAPEALPLPVPTALPRPGDGAQAADRDPEQRTAAERLRPRMGDPRLWAPLDRAYTDLTDEERAELYLRGMINDWNDSVAVAVALSGDATDWTYTDDEGRRWGLSPGRLHLGDFSIPLPLSFQLPAGRRDEVARRNWEIQDILRGVASVEVRQSWAERAREIRQRMDAERSGGGTGQGSPPPGGPGSGGGN